MFKHKVFGMNVISDFKLNAPIVDFDVVDLVIRKDIVPDDIDDIVFKNAYMSISSNQILHSKNQTGKFLVTDGKEIIVEVNEEVYEKEVIIYLEGLMMSHVLIQRKHIPLHGSGLCKDDLGLLILGYSGAGKSSLTSGLIDRGFKILTDDLIGLKKEENTYFILPSFYEQKLGMYLIDKYDLLKKINAYDAFQLATGKQFVNRSVEFSESPKALNVIVEVAVGDRLGIEEITGTKKIELLLRNLYQEEVVKGLKYTLYQFLMVSEIVNLVPMYRINRPKDIDTIDDQINLLFDVLQAR